MVKNKSGSIIAIAALFLNLLVSIPVVAETYLPQDPGTINSMFFQKEKQLLTHTQMEI